ncbi:MAG: MFS transporter [Chloroflexota bacterium]
MFYGWWILIMGSLISAVGTGMLYHSFTVFFLPLKRDLAVSSAAVSLLYGATRLEGGAEGPIVGRLIDRFGPRVVILGGAALAGVGFILLSMAHSFLSFFLIYVFVISLGYNAGFYHPVSTAVNSWFIRRRGTGFAIIGAAGSMGGVIMAPVMSYLILNFGWRTGAVIAGVIILAVALPAALPMHRSPESRGLHPDGGPPGENSWGVGGDASPAAEVDFTLKEALKTFSYWLLTLSITLRILVTVAIAAHLIPILVWKGMSEASAAYMVSLFAFGTMATTLTMGWLGDRWSKTFLSAIGVLASVVGLILLTVSQSPAVLYVLPIGLAITMGTTSLNWALIGDFFGRSSYATLRGIMGLSYGIATFFSPIYAGWVFDRTGSYAIVFITFAVVLVMAAVAFACLRHPTPPARKAPSHA